MAWPNTTVSTTNLDEGTDNPSLARADLKQAIDNINDMVDSLSGANFSDAVNGEMLVYRDGVWVPESAYTNIYNCYIRFSGPDNYSGSLYLSPSIISNNLTGITVNANQVIVPAGTYLIESTGLGYCDFTTYPTLEDDRVIMVRNETTSLEIFRSATWLSGHSSYPTTTNKAVTSFTPVSKTFSSQATLTFRIHFSTITLSVFGIKITKLA